MSEQIVAASGVLTGDASLGPGWLSWDGERITGVGTGTPPRRADVALPAGSVLAPGLVDAHVHGGGGHAFGPDPEAAARAVQHHRRAGTTTMVASLVTGPVAELERAVRALAPLVHDGLLSGVHLEGPWLNPRHRGAHEAAHLRAPVPADVERLLGAEDATVAMVTLAPELDGGLDAVRRIVGHGAAAAVGHTDATYDETVAAIAAGARVGTHLHNAMRPLHHREPGPAVALMEDDRVSVELIADGVHVHPAVLRAATRGAARPVLVTDAMPAAGAPDGSYRLGGLDVVVADGEARLRDSGAIAGSTLTLAEAVRFAVGKAGMPLVDAVRAATLAPARLLGRDDVGRLEVGARADAVVLDADLRVTGVLCAGSWLDPPR